MIKVRHTYYQLFANEKEYNQTSWKEFIARIINKVLNSEIKLLYPKWPLPATLLLDTHHFHFEATLDNTDVDYLKSFIYTL